MLIEQEIIKDYNENNNDLRMIIKKNLINIQEENRRMYNKKCNQSIKDKVGLFIKRTKFGPKFQIKQKYLELYQVTKVKKNECYYVICQGKGKGLYIIFMVPNYMKVFV